MRSSMQNKIAKLTIAVTFWWGEQQRQRKGQSLSVALRELMDQIVSTIPFPKRCQETRGELGGVPAVWADPTDLEHPDRVILWLHGGAFIAGSADSHKAFVGNLALAAGTRGCAISYRLAPEHPYPAPLDDCVTAYKGLLEQGFAPENIVVGGESAGGNLTLALLLRCKAEGIPLPAAAINLSGVSDLTFSGESWTTHLKRDPMLTREGADAMIEDYVAGHDVTDPFVSPFFGDFTDCPPIYCMAGTEEVLWSDVHTLADRLREQGVSVFLEEGGDMMHAWPLFHDSIPEGKVSLERMALFAQRAFEAKQWAAV